MTAVAGWENFHVIVGSSAGALIGLQFVVLTLIADRPAAKGQAQAGDAFATGDSLPSTVQGLHIAVHLTVSRETADVACTVISDGCAWMTTHSEVIVQL